MKPVISPKALAGIGLTTALLLLVPLTAMQFTSKMSWGAGDFVAAGALIFIAGLALMIGTRLAPTRCGRMVAAALVIAAFLTIWAELAVGLFH